LIKTNPYKHLIFIILSTCFALAPAEAQKIPYYLNFDHILDNREYFTEYGTHQTFFGVRINPGLAFTFDSIHSIHVGFNYMYEFGGEFFGVMPQVDLYYTFRKEHLEMRFGSFPRREVMDYPLMILRDSISYYRPNMDGASLAYSWEWGQVHGWVDWMGRETPETREAIHAGMDVTLQAGAFYLEAITTRAHLARTTAPGDQNQIRDDGSFVALLGADLDGRFFLDRMDLATGLLAMYERQRPAPDFSWAKAWYSTMDLGHWIFGIRGSWYLGDPSPLMYGDPLYGSGNYGRFDFFIDPFRNPRITSKIGWNLHVIPGEGLYHSQQVLIRISLSADH
jgi:hypothetical protein